MGWMDDDHGKYREQNEFDSRKLPDPKSTQCERMDQEYSL